MSMTIYTLPIARVIDEAPRVHTFLFETPKGLTWEPGAHMHVGLHGFNANGERHPELVRHMSVSTLIEEGALGFTTRLNSSDSTFKQTLTHMGPGDELSLFKFGSVLALPDDDRPVALLSQGVGIASMRPLLLDFARRRAEGGFSRTPRVTSITVDAGEQGIFEHELESLKASGLTVERARHRADFEAAVRALPDPAGTLFEVVGSDAFLRSAIALLHGLGVADASIVLDKNEAKRAPFFEA